MSRSQSGIPFKLHMYANFAGIDTSRPEIAMENKERQSYPMADNVVNDWRGFISNERPLINFKGTDSDIVRVVLTSADQGAQLETGYAIVLQEGVRLKFVSFVQGSAEFIGNSFRAGPSLIDLTPSFWGEYGVPISVNDRTTIVTSAVSSINGSVNVVFCATSTTGSPGFTVQPLLATGIYSIGQAIPGIAGSLYPQVNCPIFVLGRLGFARLNKTQFGGGYTISFSRVNNINVFSHDEVPGEPSVLRGFDLDVSRHFTGELLTGMSMLEADKLVIFSSERAIIYKVDPDLTQWAIDANARIGVGTISHNTIVDVNGDLVYCSDHGVHTLRRSAMNGSVLYTLPLSQQIHDLYRSLVLKVERKQLISAFYEKQTGTYHVMFPVSVDENYRLSFALSPQNNEGGGAVGTWSLSTFAKPTCGHEKNGTVVIGTRNGIVTVGSEMVAGMRGDGVVNLPIMWHGDMLNPKVSHAIMVMASGVGRISISGSDEAGRELGTVYYELNDPDVPPSSVGIPIQLTQPFQHKYIGLRLVVRIESDKPVRIYGIGVITKEV